MSGRAPNSSTSHVLLREVAESDLPIFFEQQSDPDANDMAAFTAKDPADREAFTAHWTKILSDEAIIKMTVLVDGQVAGQVLRFEQRPVYARAAKDNLASLRVLAKCGFAVVGEDKGFANARGQEVEEFILELGASGH